MNEWFLSAIVACVAILACAVQLAIGAAQFGSRTQRECLLRRGFRRLGGCLFGLLGFSILLSVLFGCVGTDYEQLPWYFKAPIGVAVIGCILFFAGAIYRMLEISSALRGNEELDKFDDWPQRQPYEETLTDLARQLATLIDLQVRREQNNLSMQKNDGFVPPSCEEQHPPSQ